MKASRTSNYLRALGRLGLASAMVFATVWSHAACACSSGKGCEKGSAGKEACPCCSDGESCGHHESSTPAKSCCAAKEPQKSEPNAGHSCCATGHAGANAGVEEAKVSTPACTCATVAPDRPIFPAREQKQILPGKSSQDAPQPLVAVTGFLSFNCTALTVPGVATHAPPISAPTPVLLCTFRC